jgi:hypothetical protein
VRRKLAAGSPLLALSLREPPGTEHLPKRRLRRPGRAHRADPRPGSGPADRTISPAVVPGEAILPAHVLMKPAPVAIVMTAPTLPWSARPATES